MDFTLEDLKTKVTKLEAATTQLRRSIRLFLDEKEYISAITLAGASEEILGGSLSDQSIFSRTKKTLSRKFDLPEKTVSQEHLNKIKNWLKHWKDKEDEEEIEIELETESIQYISRAIFNFGMHDENFFSEVFEFMKWIQNHRRDLLSE